MVISQLLDGGSSRRIALVTRDLYRVTVSRPVPSSQPQLAPSRLL